MACPDRSRRLVLTSLAWLAAALAPASAWAVPVPVSDVAELQAAVANASPGDEIVLAPGNYVLANKLNCTANGTANARIVIRADSLGDATVQMDNLEGFHVQGAYWEIANLVIEGVCGNDSNCEHAFHVTGDADNTWIHNNVVRNFNAQIKANGTDTGPNGSRVFPDDVVVEFNELYNAGVRQTSNPVTPPGAVSGWDARASGPSAVRIRTAALT